MNNAFVSSRFRLNIQSNSLDVAAIHRDGNRAPILFLHGFGSTKEDFADIDRYRAFEGHPFLAYDAPGCGETYCADLSTLSSTFLTETALALVDSIGFERFHLVGHSMGGLTALMLAHQNPERVLSFVNIKGNLAPEDCFLSRQIVECPETDSERFLSEFVERTQHSPTYSSALYAAGLRHKVRIGAVRSIFQSMIDFSDNGGLLNKFVNLTCPKLFMFGEQYASLSYLRELEGCGVHLANIPCCEHFPMYSNPPAMWKAIASFQNIVL